MTALAAERFDNEAWRASSQYRAGDYAGALDGWRQQPGEDALYNRGNALARLGRFDEAIATYDALLEQNPGHEDAKYNKQAIEEWLRRQQQQQSQQQSGEQAQQPSDEQQQSGEQQSQSDDASQQQAESQQAQAGESEQTRESEARQEADQSASDQQAEQPQAADAETADGEQQQPMANLEEQMSEQAAEQWLRKIPDDPGGLLRRKFLLQYRDRGGVESETRSW